MDFIGGFIVGVLVTYIICLFSTRASLRGFIYNGIGKTYLEHYRDKTVKIEISEL